MRSIVGSDTEVKEVEENRASKRSVRSAEKRVAFKTLKGAKGAIMCFATRESDFFGEERASANPEEGAVDERVLSKVGSSF